MCFTPAAKIMHNRVAPSSCDDPDDIFIAVIHFLMLSIRRNESKIAWAQFLPLGAVRSADNGTVPLSRVYDCIWDAHQVSIRGNEVRFEA